MTSEFVLKALEFGIPGLCAITLVATLVIILAEQRRAGQPRTRMIRLCYVFMSFCLILTILSAWVQFHGLRSDLFEFETGKLPTLAGGAVSPSGQEFKLHLADPNSTSFTWPVTFKKKFSGMPKVVVAIDQLSTSAPTRLVTSVDENQEGEGFTVRFEKLDVNALVTKIEARWVAIGSRQPQ